MFLNPVFAIWNCAKSLAEEFIAGIPVVYPENLFQSLRSTSLTAFRGTILCWCEISYSTLPDCP